MITFKQFISEDELISAKVLIERDCKPFLDETNRDGFLYRGVKHLRYGESKSVYDHEGNEMEYFIKNVRQDRKPLDIAKKRSKVIDDWFNDKFGIRGRSQCVFGTGEKTTLNDLKFYGEACVIFPIGQIEYIWSPDVPDLYGSMLPGFDYAKHTDEEIEEKILDWLNKQHYKKDGLSQAVMLEHEVMIKCSSYYAFPIAYKRRLKELLDVK